MQLKAYQYLKRIFRFTYNNAKSATKRIRLKVKNKGIKDCKTLSIDKLFSILDKLKQVKKTIRDMRKDNVNSDKILRDTRIL